MPDIMPRDGGSRAADAEGNASKPPLNGKPTTAEKPHGANTAISGFKLRAQPSACLALAWLVAALWPPRACSARP